MPIVIDLTTPGSGVDLSAVFLNDAADLSDFIAVEYAGEKLSPKTTAAGEVRRLVGRRRLVRTGSGDALVSESLAVTFERCTPTQVTWIRQHVGSLVCVRDHVGGKFYGVYLDAPREVATAYRDRSSMSLTFEQVTHSEGV